MPGLLVLFAFVVPFAACGPKQAAPPPVQVTERMIFPPPPDTARIQFLARYGSSKDIEEDTGGGSFLSALTGERKVEDGERLIYKPYGVSIARNKLYICDSMLAAVEILDLEKQTFEYFGKNAGEPGVIGKPISCFADPQDGSLYVTDVAQGVVLVYDSIGDYVGAIGEGDILRRPVDVQVKDDRIWVADQTGQKIVVFDRDTWQVQAELPKPAYDSPEGVRQPTALWVTDDELYVTDFGNFKIQVYDHDGEYIRSVGQYGRGFGMFVRPKGIAVDRDGILYAVDAGFQNVQMFDDTGQLLMFFGGPYKGPGTMYLPAQVIVDYDHLHLFEHLVDSAYAAKHLVIVTNQYGWDKVTVYARVEPKPGMGPAAETVAEPAPDPAANDEGPTDTDAAARD